MFSLRLALDAVVVGTNATRCSKPGLLDESCGRAVVRRVGTSTRQAPRHRTGQSTHMAPPTQHAGTTAMPDNSTNAMPWGTPFLEKLMRPLSRSSSISITSPVVYASPYALNERVPLFCVMP